MSQFKREDRYIVLKWKDVAKYLTETEQEILFKLFNRVESCRHVVGGKRSLKCVVVEHDWPEYEPVWKMIEDRVKAENPQEGGE